MRCAFFAPERGARTRTREGAAREEWSSLPCPLGTCGGQAKGTYCWVPGLQAPRMGSWQCALTVSAAFFLCSRAPTGFQTSSHRRLKGNRPRHPLPRVPAAQSQRRPGEVGPLRVLLSPGLAWSRRSQVCPHGLPGGTVSAKAIRMGPSLRFVSRELLPAPQGDRRGA